MGIGRQGSVYTRVGRVLRSSRTPRSDLRQRDAEGAGESGQRRVPGPSFAGLTSTMARDLLMATIYDAHHHIDLLLSETPLKFT